MNEIAATTTISPQRCFIPCLRSRGMPANAAPGHYETPGMGTPRLWPPLLIDTPGALIHRVKLTCRGAEAFRVGSQDRVPGLLQEAVRRQGAVEVAHAIAPDGAVIIEN